MIKDKQDDFDFTSENNSISEEVKATKLNALANGILNSLYCADWELIKNTKGILQHGKHPYIWETPKNWLAFPKEATQNINLEKRLMHFLPEEQMDFFQTASTTNDSQKTTKLIAKQLLDMAILSINRYLIICRIGPSQLSRTNGLKNSKSLSPTFIKNTAYQVLPQIYSAALSKHLAQYTTATNVSSILNNPHPADNFLHCINSLDFEKYSNDARKKISTELSRMQYLKELTLWNDYPDNSYPDEKLTQGVDYSNQIIETIDNPKKEHQPLPDSYLGEIGWKSLWISNNLTEPVIEAMTQATHIFNNTYRRGISEKYLAKIRSKELGKFLSDFNWSSSSGESINDIPFTLHFPIKGNLNKKNNALTSRPHTKYESDICKNWPPRNLTQLLFVAATVQRAHLFTVAVSLGPRSSELANLLRGCITTNHTNISYAKGLTFKFANSVEGDLRNWPLPNAAKISIERQIKLAGACELICGITKTPLKTENLIEVSQRRLWLRLGAAGVFSESHEGLQGLNEALRTYAISLGLSDTPGGSNLVVHRLRKSLARIIALALEEGPTILMQILGHEDINHTLYYILANKNLHSEVEIISREISVLRAVETIEQIIDIEAAEEKEQRGTEPVSGMDFGGKGANRIAAAINEESIRLHKTGEHFNATNIRSFAEALTFRGRTWSLVRTGIICTKSPGTQSGPCNFSKGAPEPSRCRTGCDNRLEMPFLYNDVNSSIESCLEHYQNEKLDNPDSMLIEFWKNQLLGHLSRFQSLKTKWLTNPIIKSLYEEGTDDE